MKTVVLLWITALFAALALNAQPLPSTPLGIRPVVTPGMTIGGYTFTPQTAITAVTISEGGEIAFSARWLEGDKERAAIFTLHRLVAREGDMADGRPIATIPAYPHLAINSRGDVAFDAFPAQSEVPAIFVEKQFAMTAPNDSDFSLAEDGRIVIRPSGGGGNCAADPRIGVPRKPGLLSGVQVTMPKLPRVPISINRSQTTADTSVPKPAAPATPSACGNNPLSMLAANRRGEVAFPVNTRDGAYLFLGTPVTR